MRRSLLAVAVLLTVAVSPTFAGYLIIRVLLEAGGAPTPGTPGMAPPGPGGTAPGSYPKTPPLGTPGAKLSVTGPPVMPMGGTPTAVPGDFDHTRSIVVVIPLEADLVRGRLDMKKRFDQQWNPEFRKFVVPYHGERLHASLFIDSTSIQLYEELLDKPAKKKTRHTEMQDKHQAWLRSKTDTQLLYDAIILALESGFIRDRSTHRDGSPPDDAVTYAEELRKVIAEKKLTPPADVQQFLDAWERMREATLQPAPEPSNAEIWRAQLDGKQVRVDGHYAVIYWDHLESEVIRRSHQLNDNFAAFFLWHATRGVVLKPPTQPLLVVLALDTKEGRDHMATLRHALDGNEGIPSQADGFYAPDHNIVVLASQRMDEVGRTFRSQTRQLFAKGLNREELLNAKIPQLDPMGEKGSKPDDVARATTLAVVEKLAIDESEMAAVSREGTRQLLFTTGVLPRYVTLPHWLTQGAVNFFTRPRGPAYVTIGPNDKPFMTVAFRTGYGVPNYVLQRYFLDMAMHNELNRDPSRLLENILTDAYFAGLKDGIDPDPLPPAKKKPAAPVGTPPMPGQPPIGTPPGPGMPPGVMGMPPGIPGFPLPTDTEDPFTTQRKKKNRLDIKSQATAWALYYYLARGRSGELKRYIAELNKLPRDLPIDGRTAYSTFVRVFKLSAPDGKPDDALMMKFAKDWLEYMGTVPTVGIDIPLVLPEAPKNMNMGPMGMPPGTPPFRPGGK